MVFLLGGFAAIAPMSIDMYLPGVPAITMELHSSAHQATATLSVFLAGVALGQLLAGPWSDRVGRLFPIRAGLLLYLVGALAAALAGTMSMLLAARLLQALGASAVMVTGRAVVRDMFDERSSARFFSTIAMISGLAPILAPVIGAGLLAIANWRVIFLAMAVLSLLLLLLSLPLLKESRSVETEARARGSHPLITYAALLTNRRLLGLLLAGGFNSACFFTYLASAPLVLMKIHGLSATAFSFVVASNAVGLWGTNQLNRWLLRRRAPAQILRASARNALVLSAAFAVTAVTGFGGLPLLLLLIFLVTSSTSMIQANALASALSMEPTRSGAVAALYGSLAFGVGTAMSSVAGLLYNGTPSVMMGVIALGLVAMAAAIRLAALPRIQPD
ncbi:MAG: Bcr/CflA family efflux MFS transporter [Steroidobacteraceae bacterium]